jgi:NADH:ubiquinone oxidoreductase subunit C
MSAVDLLKTEVANRFPAARVAETDPSKRGQRLEIETRQDDVTSLATVLRLHNFFLEFGTAVDLLDGFQIVYQFNRYTEPARVVVKYPLPKDAQATSLAGVYPAAEWFEREIFDMFGLRFSGHPDMRHLIMPEGSTFYPLLKTPKPKDKPAKGAAKEDA